MSERVPLPLVSVEFDPEATLPDCLRAALQNARRLQVGMAFFYGPEDDMTRYVVMPWMTIEAVLALWDEGHAASVAMHQGAHGV